MTRRPEWVRNAWQALTFRRPALMSRLAWPLLYPAAWIWRRTWLRRTPVVAVTGSIGKTSTTAAAAAAFGARFDPDSPNYGSFLAAAVLRHRPRRRPLVVEVAISRPGQMRAYARLLRPDVAIVTAIAAAHLRSFGTLDRVAAEKALLPQAVSPRGLVVVNGDDARCRAIGAAVRARVVRVGSGADCDWRIEDVEVDGPAGTRFRLARPDAAAAAVALAATTATLATAAIAAPAAPAATAATAGTPAMAPTAASAAAAAMAATAASAPLPRRLAPQPQPAPIPTDSHWGAPVGPPIVQAPFPTAAPSLPPLQLALSTQWIGRDLARCAAFGAVAAVEAGLDAPGIGRRLAALPPLPWRMQALPLAGGACLLCDAWQGTWESLQSALRELAGFRGWRRIAVLGDIQEVEGSQIAAYRELGRLAGAAADRLVFVGGRTTYERFRAGVRQAPPPVPPVERCEDAGQAAAALRGELGGRTAILIKGRHSHKLGRVAILLRGEEALCPLRHCHARGLRCELCPRLHRRA